jgi:hypothetical protein
VWPDNLAAVNIFIAIGTQWRTNMAGATGLDYNVMYARMDRLNLPEPEWLALEADLRVLEETAMLTMRHHKK